MSEKESANVRPEVAKVIQTHQNLVVSAEGNFPNQKFAGLICCVEANGQQRMLLSTKPVFETEAAAKSYMDKVIEAVKELRCPKNAQRILPS
jgi:hypothetical protein